MADYCCFFVDKDDHVRDVKPHINCADDAAAVHVAEQLLAEKLQTERWRFAAVEIWDQTRKVARCASVYHPFSEGPMGPPPDRAAKRQADPASVASEIARGGAATSPRNDFVEGLRREHRNIESLLHVLEQELAVFDRGDQPDYEVIRGVIDYFKAYPDLYHHPREELVFEKLKLRDPAAVAKIGDLEDAHREGTRRLRRVAEAVEAILQDQELLRQSVDDLIRDFAGHQREHIAMEERLFFPAALNALQSADWADLARQAAGRDDPFGQLDFAEKFNLLRRNILAMEAEAAASRHDAP